MMGQKHPEATKCKIMHNLFQFVALALRLQNCLLVCLVQSDVPAVTRLSDVGTCPDSTTEL